MKVGESAYALSVKVPPRKGPRTEATPKARPKKEMNNGRFGSGMRGITDMMDPQVMPAAPMPAIARPTMTVMLSAHIGSRGLTSFLTSCRGRSSAAYSTPNFKYEDCDKECPLRIVQLVELAVKRIEDGTCEHVSAAIPPNV